MESKIDRIDRNILELLQKNSGLTHQQIADKIGSSPTSVWRRIQNLEARGVISARVALLDRKTIGLNVCVICNVKLSHHSDETRLTFESFVASLPEVTECYAVSGSHDYTLKVVVKDVEAYERLLTRQLLNHPLVDSAASSFTLREVKYSTRLTPP